MKRNLSVIIGFAVSALLLYIAARQVDFNQVFLAYSKVKLWHVSVFVVIGLVDLGIRGLRWKLLVQPCKKISWWSMTKLETIGLALNNVLPMRLGELGRASLGQPMVGVPILTLLATILVERVMDMIALVGIFLLSARFAGDISWVAKYSGIIWMLLGSVIVGLSVLIFLEVLLEKSPAFCRVVDFFPKVGALVRQIAMGAQALRNWKLALAILLLGPALWMWEAIGYYWGSLNMGITPMLNYGQCLLLLCIGAFSVIVPAMPGYFGTYELAIQQALSSWGVDKNIAMAFATYIHINTYVIFTVTGIIFLYQTGNSLSGIWKNLRGQKTPDCETRN